MVKRSEPLRGSINERDVEVNKQPLSDDSDDETDELDHVYPYLSFGDLSEVPDHPQVQSQVPDNHHYESQFPKVQNESPNNGSEIIQEELGSSSDFNYSLDFS
ncbi:hypothetical protein QVD17_12339 [Tagetes erecta]|uniref:Uncharacterized protein n=1 Tax=Tagetes erecta TaxID=13708 RepID=A0AAD8KUS5_TARER|nr:hypothetical protein QVD17_12339 [Tagetes erecta]